jgi:hypothetical protein
MCPAQKSAFWSESTGLRQHFALDLLRVQAANFVTHLHLEPEIRGRAEVTPKARGGISRNASLPIYDGVDTSSRYAKGAGERVDAQASLGYLLSQQLARM